MLMISPRPLWYISGVPKFTTPQGHKGMPISNHTTFYHAKKSDGCYTTRIRRLERTAFAVGHSKSSRYRQYEAGLLVQGHTESCAPSHRRPRPWSPSRELARSSDQLIGTEHEHTSRPIARTHMPTRDLRRSAVSNLARSCWPRSTS
jgi:hypothetical protein